ncbi:hypothetical protein [Ekhidna sp.]
MKKIVPFLLILSIWMIGCSDDDNTGNFIGIWIATSETISNCQEEARNGTDPLTCTDVSCYKLELNSDNTYSFQRGLAIESGNWSGGSSLELCMDEEGEIICERFGVQFSGISLIFTTDSTTSGCISTFFFNPEVATDTIQ